MAGVTTYDRVHLVVCLGGAPDAHLLQRIGEVCGVSSYDLRLRLKGDLPRPLVCCESIEAAEAKALQLNDAGLTTIVYVQNDLPTAEPFHAIALARTKTTLRIRDRCASIDVAAPDIALLVYGRRMLTRETQEFKPPTWIFPSDVVTRGLTMALSGGMHKSRYETGGQEFLMFFRRDPRLPAIEIGQEGFDFQCLGKHRGRTRQESLELVVAALRRLLPDVPFDDRLMRGQSNNRGEAFYNRRMVDDSGTANATLIYWQMLAEQSGRRHFTAPQVSRG